MADDVVYQPPGARPRGQVMAEVYVHPLRFGRSLSLGVRDHDGQVWLARGSEEYGLVWVKADIRTQPTPLMSVDDEVVAAMLKALNKEPIKARGDYALDHLADALSMRDRLFAMVETVFKTQFKEEPR